MYFYVKVYKMDTSQR